MEKEFHLKDSPLESGYRIFDDRLDVAGTSFRKSATNRFLNGSHYKLRFLAEPKNSHDSNAIMVLGESKGLFRRKEYHIGYVPKEIAKKLNEKNLLNVVKPRLLKTYRSDNGFIEIFFQIIGPKEKFEEYKPKTNTPSNQAKSLIGANNVDAGLKLLYERIEGEEVNSKNSGYGVGPMPYKTLAIQLRKLKRYDEEVALLERYMEQNRAPGKSNEILAKRLARARELRKPK